MKKNYLIVLVLFIAIGIGLFVLIKQKKTTIPSTTLSNETTVAPTNFSDFSLEKAPSQSLKGILSNMNGEIKWQARTATEAAIINSPIEIQQGENLFTGDNSNLTLTFLGTCIIDIFEKTEVDIIQTLPKNLVFSQVDGTATYSNLGENPITVRTSYLLTQLEGDVKIVRNSEKSTVIITVITGNVTFAYNDKNLKSHVIKAKEGQIFTFNYGTQKGVLK